MKLYFSIALFFYVLNVKAQIYDVDTLVYNGDINKHINIVILGDGYTGAQMTQFKANAQTMSNYLFTISPFNQYKNYFNVFIVKVPSPETGVKHPATASDVFEPVIPVSNPNNYFSSQFDYGGIHRLLVPTNNSNINTVLANNFPQYDQVLILANSTEYGGSGGLYATSSIHSDANEVSVHELGHSFGLLADEYEIGGQGERPNRTTDTNPATIKWKNWLNINNISIYPIGVGGYQRPHQSCKMRYLGSPFCSVCVEALIERIHSLSTTILSFLPSNNSILTLDCSNMNFSLNLIKPIPNTLSVTWKLNGIIIGNAESLVLNQSLIQSGNNILTAFVIDNNTLSKSSSHLSSHTFQVSWTLTPIPTSIPLTTPANDITVPTISTFKASQYIQASNKILAAESNITYQAGKNVQLSNGFEAQKGVVFKASIGGCN